MLRKLFISLLILSALTSEGISVLPANYACFYQSSGSEAGILEELNTSVSQVQTDRNGSAISSAFTLTYESIQKLKYKNYTAVETGEKAFSLVYTDLCLPANSLETKKDTIFVKSGLSPPILI